MALDRRVALVALVGLLWVASELYPSAQHSAGRINQTIVTPEYNQEKELIHRSYDEKAKYFLMSAEANAGIVRALVERVGIDSLVYTLTDIDCSTRTFRFIGDISFPLDAAAAHRRISPDMVPKDHASERWVELVPGSSKSDLVRFICR